MRLGLLSDIHGNYPALEAALAGLHNHNVEKILIAGDIVGYYPYFNEVIDLLKKTDCLAIKGNHESYFFGDLEISESQWQNYMLDQVERELSSSNREWLLQLKTEEHLLIDGLQIDLYHGSPWRIDEYVYPDHQSFDRFTDLDSSTIIMGHTHIPMIKELENKVLINPGACGQPRDYIPGACYGVLETGNGSVTLYRADYDIPGLMDDLRTRDCPEPLLEILVRKR